jgi:Rod binding domain-containing protein
MNILSATRSSQGADPLPADLKSACRALEQQFVSLLMRTMRQAMVPNASKGAEGFAKDTAYAMLDDQWSRMVSEGDGLGIGKMMYEQLTTPTIKSTLAAADEKLTAKDVKPQQVLRGYARADEKRTLGILKGSTSGASVREDEGKW